MGEWELEDVEVVAAQNPDSFFIASREERKEQRPGNRVRLHFVLTSPVVGSPRAERMWVEIQDGLSPNGEYTGVLTNAPAFLKTIQKGDAVRFEPRHIAQILVGRSDPNWVECGEQRALVSEMVFEPGEMVRFAYREKGDKPDDSGWRIFSGHETDAYTNDPKNIRICNILWLLDKDPTLLSVVRSEIGTAFERADSKSPWQQVRDWQKVDG